jgi:hypothetical protein
MEQTPKHHWVNVADMVGLITSFAAATRAQEKIPTSFTKLNLALAT